jgi:hypothetical protein
MRANRPAGPPRQVPQPPSLPPAQIPWPEPAQPAAGPGVGTRPVPPQPLQAGHGRPGERQDATARPPAEPGTTLGDLAERLEEALAREVHGSRRPGPGQPEYDLGGFGLGENGDAGRNSASATLPPTQSAGPARTPVPTPALPPAPAAASAPDRASATVDRRDQEPPKTIDAAPEPDVRRDLRGSPDRPDEAPVISLSARRREPVDPLEDEMARLLGELTGDTTRR